MKRSAVATLVTAWAMAGCRPTPSAPTTSVSPQASDVLAAVLQRQLMWESNLNRVYFVMVGPDRVDPPADLLSRLHAVYPQVEPASAAAGAGRPPAVQQRDVILWASVTRWESADRAVVRSEFSRDGVTFAFGGLGGEEGPDHTVTVDRANGEWRVPDRAMAGDARPN